MKKTMMLALALLTLFFAMCKKSEKENYDTETIACGIKNPIKNITWLNEKYKTFNLSASTSEAVHAIVLYNYQGQDIIEIDYAYNNYWGPKVYSCDGKELTFDNEQNNYDDYLKNRREIKVLYGSYKR